MSFLQTYLSSGLLAALLFLLPCQHCRTHRLSLHNIFTEIIRYLDLRFFVQNDELAEGKRKVI
jgi:hypothetical protein